MRGTASQQAQDLLEKPWASGLSQVVARGDHGVVHGWRDAQVESRGELDGPQDADRVLAKADHRIADRADGPPAQIFDATTPVEHLAPVQVIEERVHREIAPQRVFVRLAEDVIASDEQIVEDLACLFLRRLHGRVTAERRYLDDFAAAEQDVREAKSSPDDAAVAEKTANVLRTRICCDVEILGLAAEQKVAHAAAHQVGLKAAALEAAHHLCGIRVDAVVVEDVVVPDQPRARVSLQRVAVAPRLRRHFGKFLDRVGWEVGRRR